MLLAAKHELMTLSPGLVSQEALLLSTAITTTVLGVLEDSAYTYYVYGDYSFMENFLQFIKSIFKTQSQIS